MIFMASVRLPFMSYRAAAKKVSIKEMCIAGVWFGGFQALMPFLGWILGSRFKYYIENFDHWIAFLLLVAIGANMLREAFSDECEKVDNSFALKTMFVMAVATSIDALAVGITFGNSTIWGNVPIS